MCPLWLPSCNPWSGVCSSTPRWRSTSPCRWPRKRIVPVLIRPDGSRILTRWPTCKSMGEWGTKTRWCPGDVLHDLTLQEGRVGNATKVEMTAVKLAGLSWFLPVCHVYSTSLLKTRRSRVWSSVLGRRRTGLTHSKRRLLMMSRLLCAGTLVLRDHLFIRERRPRSLLNYMWVSVVKVCISVNHLSSPRTRHRCPALAPGHRIGPPSLPAAEKEASSLIKSSGWSSAAPTHTLTPDYVSLPVSLAAPRTSFPMMLSHRRTWSWVTGSLSRF